MQITVSLKEATRERPGVSGAAAKAVQKALPYHHTPVPGNVMVGDGQIICRPMWSAADFRTFSHLCDRVMDPDQKKRQDAQVWMLRFKQKHGEDICNMMLAELRRRDALAWFKSKKEQQG